MKSHPYDELYLTQVVETQGKFFEKLQDIESVVSSKAGTARSRARRLGYGIHTPWHGLCL